MQRTNCGQALKVLPRGPLKPLTKASFTTIEEQQAQLKGTGKISFTGLPLSRLEVAGETADTLALCREFRAASQRE